MSLWVTAVQSNEKKIVKKKSIEMCIPPKIRDNLSSDGTEQDCVFFAVLYWHRIGA